MAKFINDGNPWWNIECYDPKIVLCKNHINVPYLKLNEPIDIQLNNVKVIGKSNRVYVISISREQIMFLEEFHRQMVNKYNDELVKLDSMFTNYNNESVKLGPMFTDYNNIPSIFTFHKSISSTKEQDDLKEILKTDNPIIREKDICTSYNVMSYLYTGSIINITLRLEFYLYIKANNIYFPQFTLISAR